MELLELLLLGAVVAVVARLATHGRGVVGVRPGLVLGAVGSLAGGLVARAAGVHGGARWATAAAAAVVLLVVAGAVQTARRRRA
ncbi:MAG TPA: GlsB/YeaQ/YmgE family stress response membrane protein [Mycobacteriales bacterium]